MIEFTSTVNDQGVATNIYPEIKVIAPHLAGKQVRVKITVVKRNRSHPQNRYYWGVVVKMIRDSLYELGHELTYDETHEWLKHKFNSVELVNENTGETETLPKPTKSLSKDDFGDYMERVKRWAASFLDLYIPDPNEQTELI